MTCEEYPYSTRLTGTTMKGNHLVHLISLGIGANPNNLKCVFGLEMKREHPRWCLRIEREWNTYLSNTLYKLVMNSIDERLNCKWLWVFWLHITWENIKDGARWSQWNEQLIYWKHVGITHTTITGRRKVVCCQITNGNDLNADLTYLWFVCHQMRNHFLHKPNKIIDHLQYTLWQVSYNIRYITRMEDVILKIHLTSKKC